MDVIEAAHGDSGTEPSTVVLHAGEGRYLEFFGGVQTLTVKLTGKDSLGRLGIYENTMAPKTRGASPHFHKALVEVFYVLEGEVLLYAKDRKLLATAGSTVSVPPNTIHAFANPGDQPNKFLIIFSNDTGREKYFEQVSLYSNSDPLPDKALWQKLDLEFDTHRTPEVEFTLEKP